MSNNDIQQQCTLMKKFFMKTALVAVLGLSMVSCKSTFYQVYDVDYDSNMKMQDNSLVYENEDCKVLYNLWSEGGFVKFAIINKTDKDIFVNLTQTFFTLNGLANEYYQGRTYSTATYNQVTTTSASVNSMVMVQQMPIFQIVDFGEKTPIPGMVTLNQHPA